MKVLVLRDPSELDCTSSDFLFDDKQMGVGIEDEKRAVKVKGETCISEGVYEMGLRTSPKFSYSYYRDDDGNLIESKHRTAIELQRKYHTAHEMIWVMNVPNFEYVLWHWGNSDDDTDGCYIVGSKFGIIDKQKAVLASRDKYKEIYPILFKAIKKGKVTVEYKLKPQIS
jgi:hypothetical protein